jgi:hypothetical protein
MRELAASGWVVAQKIPFRAGSKKDRWFYHLTDEANKYLEKALTGSLHGNTYELTDELPF